LWAAGGGVMNYVRIFAFHWGGVGWGRSGPGTERREWRGMNGTEFLCHPNEFKS
jgi:hypothetical protein